jgi:hypothetical protein
LYSKDRLPLSNINHTPGAVMVVFVWQMELQLPVQSVPINTNVVSSNLDQGEVYNIMW